MTCIFCNIAEGSVPRSVVYEDADFVVINDIHPQAPVHLLVIPKIHSAHLVEMDESLSAGLFRVIRKIIRDRKLAGYKIVNNGGTYAEIFHTHVHILSR